MNSQIDWLRVARMAKYRAPDLARLLRISLRQLERCFAADCGRSPQSWLHEVRLWKAAQLIAEGSSASEIIFDLGFKDHAHFYHRFKLFHGCTPHEYVERHLRHADGKHQSALAGLRCVPLKSGALLMYAARSRVPARREQP